MLLPKTVFYRSRCHITPIPGIKISHFIFSLLHLTFHILIGKFSFWKDCNCIESIEWLGGVVTMRERDVLWWQDQSKTWLCMGPHSRVVGSCEPHQPPDVVADWLSYISPNSASPSTLSGRTTRLFANCLTLTPATPNVNLIKILISLLFPHKTIFSNLWTVKIK